MKTISLNSVLCSAMIAVLASGMIGCSNGSDSKKQVIDINSLQRQQKAASAKAEGLAPQLNGTRFDSIRAM